MFCILYIAGESALEVQTEADSNDINERLHDDKPRPYECTVCEKRFRKKSSLNVHKTSHTGEKLYSCTQCGKCLATQSLLTAHISVHSSNYKCTECGKGFGASGWLRMHCRRNHSGERPFACTVCSKLFTTITELTMHSRVHSGEKT